MKTIFCDIDGVIFEHPDDFLSLYRKVILNPVGTAISGSKEQILDWYTRGYKIIFTTGRPESEYNVIYKALTDSGFYFHKLIMDCGASQRYVINDIDPKHPEVSKAFGVNLNRNQGLKDVTLPE